MTDFLNCEWTELHRFLGAIPHGAKGTEFTVWAPGATRIELELDGGPHGIVLTRGDDGLHKALVPDAQPGDRYFYRIDGGPPRPDPASRFQPQGVHGPSEIVDPQFAWADDNWKGLRREDLVIYELHLGAFTTPGTVSAAIDRLDELVDLGVSAVELMPVAASAGKWNWGYDGVAFFSPSEAFGSPADFRQFVNAAHQRSLAVLLDVVYNHLGPEGNYLGDFGPYLSDKHHTVWGEAPNFDHPTHGDAVRRFFLANVLHWIDEYHLDGLRVDAIHCMKDDRDPHVVSEMASLVRQTSESLGRNVLMIAESNVYDPEMTQLQSEGGIGFDAMWCDDFLHSVFATLRPDEQLCHRTYRRRKDLEQTVQYGYVYEGTLRKQRGRARLDSRVKTHGLIYSIQNHDFIGNHPLGLRLHQLAGHEAHRAAACLMILSPAIPMLFMGEEFACEKPFRFFVDFSDPQLRQAVVEGRRREYPQHDWEAGILPTDPQAFLEAKIGDADAGNSETRHWYRSLIAIRNRFRTSGLLVDSCLQVKTAPESDLYLMRYRRGSEVLTVAVRLGADMEAAPVELGVEGAMLLCSSDVAHAGNEQSRQPVELRMNQVLVAYSPDPESSQADIR